MPRLKGKLRGPTPASIEDVPAMNEVFSDAFTDRYRRDGLVGVRVPRLNPQVWRYAIDDAADGAMVWHDERGELVAFNMVHQSGGEGWMGPLAVRPEYQARGLGKRVVMAGVEWLEAAGSRVIGLETMPRTVDNIGFYSGLGFIPRHLTVTLTRELQHSGERLEELSSGADLESRLAECRQLAGEIISSCDFTRELRLTASLGLGETSLLRSNGSLAGFSLWHSTPLAEGRPADELRVLKVVAANKAVFADLVRGLAATGHARGLRRMSIRCQTAYSGAYRALVDLGFHVQWTDLRMTLAGREEPHPATGVVFSNWEI